MKVKELADNVRAKIAGITSPLSALPPKVRVAAVKGVRLELRAILAFLDAIEFASSVPRLEGRGPVAVVMLLKRLQASSDAEYYLTGDTVATTRLAWLRLTDGTIPLDHPVRPEVIEQFGEPGEVEI